jgi:hypothetical protein
VLGVRERVETGKMKVSVRGELAQWEERVSAVSRTVDLGMGRETRSGPLIPPVGKPQKSSAGWRRATVKVKKILGSD